MFDILPASTPGLCAAAHTLQMGRIAAFPVESVYEIGADSSQPEAVARLKLLAGAPENFTPTTYIARNEDAAGLAQLSSEAESLMLRFWPGPLTLRLPSLQEGHPPVLLRCPATRATRDLIEAVGAPLATLPAFVGRAYPSISAQMLAEARPENITLLLAGGRAMLGLESTVVDLTQDKRLLLRTGPITQDEIEETIGQPIHLGSMARLRAPPLPFALRLDIRTPAPDEAYLAFGPAKEHAGIMLNLSATGDLHEAAANLYAHLHTLASTPNITRVAVAPIPLVGLGIAINDRLQAVSRSAEFSR